MKALLVVQLQFSPFDTLILCMLDTSLLDQ